MASRRCASGSDVQVWKWTFKSAANGDILSRPRLRSRAVFVNRCFAYRTHEPTSTDAADASPHLGRDHRGAERARASSTPGFRRRQLERNHHVRGREARRRCVEDSRVVGVQRRSQSDTQPDRGAVRPQGGDLKNLDVAWAIGFPGQGSGTGAAIVGDTMFVAAGGLLAALDTASGCVKWSVRANSRNTPSFGDLNGRKVVAVSVGPRCAGGRCPKRRHHLAGEWSTRGQPRFDSRRRGPLQKQSHRADLGVWSRRRSTGDVRMLRRSRGGRRVVGSRRQEAVGIPHDAERGIHRRSVFDRYQATRAVGRADLGDSADRRETQSRDRRHRRKHVASRH